jgi:orotidine-5'-phosphate decarboxylase
MTFEERPDYGFRAEVDYVSNPTSGTVIAPKKRLIVALDMPTVSQAQSVVDELGSSVEYYKIGLELLFGGGLELAKKLHEEGKWIFLDMKLLDIGNTVEKAVANIAELGFEYLTVHGIDSKTLKSAVRGKGKSNLKLLSVTVLTSLDAHDLGEQGISERSKDLVLRRARLAQDCGFDGVISSGHEAASIRSATGVDFIIKTPGIRPSGSAVGDQVRVMTPGEAIAAGANFLVVGRPITQAKNRRAVAEQITSEIEQALKV